MYFIRLKNILMCKKILYKRSLYNESTIRNKLKKEMIKDNPYHLIR